MTTASWITLAVLAAAVFWAIVAYNALVQRRNRIANAFSQIDVQLKRRYDLVPNLVEVAWRYLAHEASTLEAVIRARATAVGAAAAVRVQPNDAAAMGKLGEAEQALGGSMGRLMVLAENYPELKADATMQSLSEELTSTENRISFARQAYNDEVLEYNNATAQFPSVLVARACRFEAAAMLQATQTAEEREAPRLAF
jgi:LemA protein